jgi:NurA-like 5'-3' nuclease
MASGNFSDLKKQARYIDETISELNLKLAYPGSMFKPSKIHHTENILEELMSENEEILVNGYPFVLSQIRHNLGSKLQDPSIHLVWLD